MKCIAIDQEIIHEWDSFPTTRCCQNALNFFTQALAKQAIQQGNLFLHNDQWGRCASGSFEHQPSDHNFKDVRDNCSSLTSSNFDHACKDCTSAIKSVRDHFLNQFNAKDNETERAICLVAVVISVTTTKLNDPSLIDDFFRCLPGLNTLDGEQYLVYEYCSAGNLAQHLLKDLEAKLSDFGLAKMLGMEESKVFTDVRGTIGYMDPEYMSNAKLTCASDMYSFVLCVAKSSKGRPTIEVVVEEMEKVLKNTLSDKKAAEHSALPVLRRSHSVGHVIPV
ncbi:hypothetical protein RDI58_024660 [Solanum bulbocastanum]|uniref:non-specific serine/threonine protein kinase n=1 Tax=Solanum bulbocastanum TaxID=147425 RepID=A0AAN8Y3N5_SOLBU